MSLRFFYVAGPANVIQTHKHWRKNEDDPSETWITFSSQFEDFCRDVGAEAYIVSHYEKKEILHDGAFTLEHRPKPMRGATGAFYHLAQIRYGFSLLMTAINFQPDIAVIRGGSANPFVMALFRLAGVRIVTILHNTLWPRGFPPTRLARRLLAGMDGLFFRWASSATICVSPECIRQVEQLTKGRARHLYQMRVQYRPESFSELPPPPPHRDRPFRIIFAGRIIRPKGVFDVLEIARKVEELAPGRVRWDICGSGPELENLKCQHKAMGLDQIVTIRGWTCPEELRQILGKCHLSIVPTRSDFAEGMAATAIEAILSGRPVITNQVVPALEVLRSACVEATTNDIDSYAEEILKLIDDPNLYRILCEACAGLQNQFYDQTQGKTAILKRIIEQLYPKGAKS